MKPIITVLVALCQLVGGAAAAAGQSVADIETRDQLIADQENLLNAYRCMFNTDTQLVAGGCADPDQITPGPAPGSPTMQDLEVRDQLIAAQEELLNVYRCEFDIDTQLVAEGCPGQSNVQTSALAVPWDVEFKAGYLELQDIHKACSPTADFLADPPPSEFQCSGENNLNQLMSLATSLYQCDTPAEFKVNSGYGPVISCQTSGHGNSGLNRSTFEPTREITLVTINNVLINNMPCPAQPIGFWEAIEHAPRGEYTIGGFNPGDPVYMCYHPDHANHPANWSPGHPAAYWNEQSIPDWVPQHWRDQLGL